MRYERKKDWVEIIGVSERPMRDLVVMDTETADTAHKAAIELTTDACFIDNKGNTVDWRGDMIGLSTSQWRWWKAKIWAAAREEILDPET